MGIETGEFSVLLSCTVCDSRREQEFSMPELLGLVDKQFLQMDCEKCGIATPWCAVQPDRRNSRRRASHRVPVEMPIRVEGDPGGIGFSEVTKTFDISKGGVRFFSKHNYGKGMEVLARVPYDEEFERRPVRAKVIWVRPITKGYEVGIEFIN